MGEAAALAWAAAMLRSATPLLLALLGETLTQRAGIINLGVEGQMLVGAVVGFGVAATFGHPLPALLAGAAAGLTLSLVHALLCLGLRANQIGSGIAVWMLGLGVSSYYGRAFIGGKVTTFAPVLGISPVIWAALALVPIVGWWLYRTRPGLVWRAVGESVENARALGVRPWAVQLWAILVGGFLSGLGGAVLSVDYTQTWANEITKGRGLVAVGLVIVARWNPFLVLPTALFFGLCEAAVLRLQAAGLAVSSYLLACLPYAACLAVLTLVQLTARHGRDMPEGLKAVFADEGASAAR
jgi:simple sugar transport system permease protein